MTINYAASWIADFPLALSLPDVTVASCPVPKIQMINLPIHVASPTTNRPIITTTPRPSQLSDIKNIAASLRRNESCLTLYTLSGTRGVSVPDGLCVDRQGGDEEDRQGAEEGRDE